MKVIKNHVLHGQFEKDFLVDIFCPNLSKKNPIVIFSHGFKGFKDWGQFSLIAETFAQAGIAFIKFNFSHNGTTLDQPDAFADLEAFGHNNFEKELSDLTVVLDSLDVDNFPFKDNLDTNHITLIGHSRGGGISILKASVDSRVKKIITWASVNEFGKYWDESVLQEWKKEGVMYIYNSRTQQQMPMYYKAYEKCYQNHSLYDIPSAVKKIDIPFLIIHGTDDATVTVEKAKEMKLWNPSAELFLIENADHTFGGKHPYNESELPTHTKLLVKKSIDFILSVR